MDNLIGKTLGQYQIIEEIGRGGMGTVYKAYQPSLNRHVAIKVLPPHLTGDKEFITRFRREAQSTAKLLHPNIIRVYDFSEEDGIYYLVMDYIHGTSLSKRLKEEKTLDLQTALSIVEQIGAALDYAHDQGIVHRDVKPSNVLLTPEGQATLTDFGIAKAAEETKLTKAGVSVGTPEYMSPEQGLGEEVDGKSDIYSLGVILFEMVTGEVPFKADTPLATLHKQVYDPPPAPRRINPRIPRGVERVILKALAKEPARRYASGREMAQALARASGERARGGATVILSLMIGLAILVVVLGAASLWPRREGILSAASKVLSQLMVTRIALTPTPSPTPQMVEYVVQWGDTLSAIAKRYGVPVDALMALNNITDPKRLRAGQRLRIPVGTALPPTSVSPPPTRPRPTPTPTPPVLARYPQRSRLGDVVMFWGYDLNMTTAAPGETLHLTLYWQALAVADTSYTVFTHLLDGENRIWAQKDNIPVRGTHPTTEWVPGEIVKDEFDLTVKPDAPAGEYIIEIGLYDAPTGQRLPTFDPQGRSLGDRIVLSQRITIQPK